MRARNSDAIMAAHSHNPCVELSQCPLSIMSLPLAAAAVSSWQRWNVTPHFDAAKRILFRMANSAPFPHKVSWDCLPCSRQPPRHHELQTPYPQRLLGHHPPLPLAARGNCRLAWFSATFSALQCYQLIDDPETRDIVDWTEDGAAFVVHNAKVPAATFRKLLPISSLNCLITRGCLLLSCPEQH